MVEGPTRDELVQLCTDGVVPHDRWRNRDSSSAQRQLGEARALLAAGCDFQVLHGRLVSDADTWWVEIAWNGFGYFDWGGSPDDETYYIPTRSRLDRVGGGDWY